MAGPLKVQGPGSACPPPLSPNAGLDCASKVLEKKIILQPHSYLPRLTGYWQTETTKHKDGIRIKP